MKNFACLCTSLLLATFSANGADSGWFARPYVGLSQLSDTDGMATNINGLSGNTPVDLDSGFTAGLGIGYHYNASLSVELAWEYRSNDSETFLAQQDRFTDGNYASSIFYLNGFYHFQPTGNWTPYVGAGIGWAQEIDIDLERDGVEQSLSGDGDIGFQLFAGSRYQLNQQWDLHAEVRYGSMTGIDLEGENITGSLTDLDYKTTTVQLGFNYRF